MWRQILGLSLLATMVVSLSAAAADKKPKAGLEEPKPAIDSDKLTPGEFIGKLASAPGSDGTFTLEIPYQHMEPNPNYRAGQNNTRNNGANNQMRNQQRIAQLQQQISQARTPQAAASAMQQMQQAMAQMQMQMARGQGQQGSNMFRVVNDSKAVEFHTAENLVVRFQNLPAVYDEKGNMKKYTPEEIKQLKGNKPNLPGYESKLEDLQVGQTIKVTLAHKKPEAKKDEEKDKDANKNPADRKTQVTTIMIVKENSDANTTAAAPKKKAK